MARRLLGAGFAVTVFNRTPARAEPLAAAGARVAGSPREAAAGAEVVFSMVADDAASRAMWLGPDGAIAGAPITQSFHRRCQRYLRRAWRADLYRINRLGQFALKACPSGDGTDAMARHAISLRERIKMHNMIPPCRILKKPMRGAGGFGDEITIGFIQY